MGKRSLWLLVGALVYFGMCGCGPSHNTVEEADRQGIDVERQILLAQDVELDRAEAALKESPDLKTVGQIMPTIERMREKNSDAKALNAQLLSNFHAPQQPQIYSHAEVQSLIKRMLDAHTVTFWASVSGALLAGGLGVIGLARSPLAKMIPGIGTILTSMDSTLGAVETWMQKMKASGKPELGDVADGLQNVLAAAHEDAKVSPYVAKALAKVKLLDDTAPLGVTQAVHDVADYAVADAVSATATG